MHFVFDGGVLADDTPIRLQESELDDYRFVDAERPAPLPAADDQHPGGRRAPQPRHRGDRVPAVDRLLILRAG